MTSQPLSFPADVYAALSPADHLLACLKSSSQPTRPSGRSPSQLRPLVVNTNSLTHCNGSAVVRLGDTAAVCGVRAEVLYTRDIANPLADAADTSDATRGQEEIMEYNLVVPNVELSTGCNAAHLPGNPPSAVAQTISHRLLRLLHTTQLIDPSNLRISYTRPSTGDEDEEFDDLPKVEVVAYWTLYLDILIISLDGNAFDAAWFALLAALRNTRLPAANWNADLEMVVCSDEARMAARLQLNGCPVPLSFAVFEPALYKGMGSQTETWVLADPDGAEEANCRETLTVVSDSTVDGVAIKSIEKSGGAVVGRHAMRDILALVSQRWAECSGLLDEQDE